MISPNCSPRGGLSLLYGQTGAGKTLVIDELVKRCLQRGEKILRIDTERGTSTVTKNELDQHFSNFGVSLDSTFRIIESHKPDSVFIDSLSDLIDYHENEATYSSIKYAKEKMDTIRVIRQRMTEYPLMSVCISMQTQKKTNKEVPIRRPGGPIFMADAVYHIERFELNKIKAVEIKNRWCCGNFTTAVYEFDVNNGDITGVDYA